MVWLQILRGTLTLLFEVGVNSRVEWKSKWWEEQASRVDCGEETIWRMKRTQNEVRCKCPEERMCGVNRGVKGPPNEAKSCVWRMQGGNGGIKGAPNEVISNRLEERMWEGNLRDEGCPMRNDNQMPLGRGCVETVTNLQDNVILTNVEEQALQWDNLKYSHRWKKCFG